MTQERPASTRSRDRKYTWDDTIAAIGKDFSSGRERVAQETVETTAVNRYCEVWEMGNPLYWYKDVAKQAGYQNVVAPWSSIKQTFTPNSFWRPGQPTRFPVDAHRDASVSNPVMPEDREEPLPKPETTVGIITDVQIEFFEPACIGDNLTTKGSKLVNVRVRETRIGYGAFMNRETEFYNQRGQLVARMNRGGYSYNPGEKAPK